MGGEVFFRCFQSRLAEKKPHPLGVFPKIPVRVAPIGFLLPFLAKDGARRQLLAQSIFFALVYKKQVWRRAFRLPMPSVKF